jgi:hypothetical protein
MPLPTHDKQGSVDHVLRNPRNAYLRLYAFCAFPISDGKATRTQRKKDKESALS